MASVITIAGEKLFAAKAQANEQLDIDTFIFANVPNQDPTAPINREEGIPTEHKVHEQIVQQVGRINDNVVVYSTVLDSLTGPFEFNWVGLYSSVNQTLVAINHIPTTVKTITEPGVAGNILNRNFGIEYSGIADLTGINVAPETWQLDFTARLGGMDKLTQQLAADMNGKDWFIEDGFKVAPRATANSFSVLPGVGYVSGLRIELKQEHILTLQSYPQFVYVDAWFSGTANSVWTPQVAFTVTNGEMDDYIDVQGVQHYVYKLAVVNAADDVEDLRNTEGLSEKLDKTAIYTTINEIESGKYRKLGSRVIATDRANALFEIRPAIFIPNGVDILDVAPGLVAVLQYQSVNGAEWGVNAGVDCSDNIAVIAGKNPNGVINIDSGDYIFKLTTASVYGVGLIGVSDISTTVKTPKSSDSAFKVQAGKQLRSTKIKSASFYQEGFQHGNVGTGKGIDLTDAQTVTNIHLEDISLNWFGVGYQSSRNAFSNQFDNVRANFCGESFKFIGDGQLINHTFNNCYSSQPTINGLFIGGCKNFVFNGYNSGSGGAPHVNIAGSAFGIIFNSPNFEQDAGTLGANTEAIRCQSDSEVTFNYPTFATPKATEKNTYLFRVMNSAVVYINNPKIIGSDENIQHILIQDSATVFLNDPKGVIDDDKIVIYGSGKLIKTNDIINTGFVASGRVEALLGGSSIITGLQKTLTDYAVEIDPQNDEIVPVLPQVTQSGTGTIKVRFINISNGTENYGSYPVKWRAR
ncbi:phage tail-collar fiber domain-containing protein [Shewanella sp. 0m-8]